MSDHVIEAVGLTRYFGDRPAVSDLNLTVPKGCIFGFLGRNGSGKSTTLRLLLGLLEPTRGSATVLGHDCRTLSPETRARIGYMAEGHPLYGWMRVDECGRFQSRFYSNWNQRVFRAVVDHFRLRDRTILFSSHLLSDVERVADQIAILDQSVLRANCPIGEFRRRVKSFLLHYDQPPPPLPEIPGMLRAVRTEQEVRLTAVNAERNVRQTLDGLGAASIEEISISLEEAFIDYLGERGENRFFLSDVEEPS